jgi:hypothetical protein
MKRIFKLLLIVSTLIFSTGLYADVVECGINSDGTIIKESMEVCNSDISFKILYMLFGDVLEDSKVKPFVDLLVTVPESTKQIHKIAGLSAPLLSIFQVLGSIIFTIGTILMFYQTSNYLYKASSSGEFMGQGQKKVASVATQGLVAIFLITPINSVLVIQVIILLMSIMGIMLANYFTASFLGTIEIQSSKVEIDDVEILAMAKTFAATLTATELCKEKTTQMILNEKLTVGSQWNKESPDQTGSWYNDNDMKEFNELVYECRKYYGRHEESKNLENQPGAIEVLIPDIPVCDDEISNADITYYPDDFGADHSCGSVQYAWPDLRIMLSQAPTSEEQDAFDSVEEMLKDTDLKSKFSPYKNFTTSFYSNNRSKIENIVKSLDKDKEKNKQLKDIYNIYSKKLFDIIKADSNLSNEFSGVKSSKLKSDLIYSQHLSVVNYLLGGSLDDTDWFNEYSAYQYDAKKIYGIDTIKVSAAKSALSLEKAHCSYSWMDLQKSRKTYKIYKHSTTENDSLESFINNGNNGGINFECMFFKRNFANHNGNGNGEFYNVLELDPNYFIDLVVDQDKISINPNKQIVLNTAKNYKEVEYVKHLKDALVEVSIVSGYHYAVKKAAMEHLALMLKEVTDTKILVETRQKGWASLGGMMLAISKEQSNAQKFSQAILSTAIATAGSGGDAQFMNFQNFDALASKEQSVVDFRSALLNMKVGAVLLGGTDQGFINSYKDTNISDAESDRTMIEGALNWIRNYIFSPMKYIKMGSGMDVDDSLVAGLEKCSQDNDCYPSETHPINALMMFGHETIDRVVMIVLVGEVSNLIANLEISLGPDKSGIKSATNKITKLIAFVGGSIGVFIKILQFVASIIAAVINLIEPALGALFLVGVLCGYLVPTMPYMIFTIVFLGWIINIFTVMVASPFWILLLANLKEDGNTSISFSKIWSITGSVLLKPPLITIAMIFSWTMASVSLFFINSTIFTVIESTSNNGSIINSIISYTATYVLYITLIYIVLQHSFKIMTSFADQISQLMDVQGTGDSQMYGSLGVERLLAASMMSESVFKPLLSNDQNSLRSQASGTANNMAHNIVGKSRNKRKNTNDYVAKKNEELKKNQEAQGENKKK